MFMPFDECVLILADRTCETEGLDCDKLLLWLFNSWF